MRFVMTSCAGDLWWLITTRAFHDASEIAAPVRFDARDTNIIRSERRASSSLDVALRVCFTGGRQ
jgi:hypothetical protein